ncbi:glucose-methanol-choline oxidoreductase [Artomyces pyxidatus]|uniref:Glucose-methanol-choline oxidoreductase n=1 Tax=Artomyces pyxidatus TaxID=48021 RepID=A0ACB8SNH1_9AGAM|nr:glucose-methanol-choline oxidoreductase [Artomyces pyxidatus]
MRSSAMTAYYEPNAERENFVLLTGSQAIRLILDACEPEAVVATGVEYSNNGQSFTARAAREVIVCAGSYQSPQLLELSGIGWREILEKYNI